MASHKLTTYIAKNPPDAVRLIDGLKFQIGVFFSIHNRRQEQQQHQIQKQKINQKISVMHKQVVIEIPMKVVQQNQTKKP